MTLLEKIHLNGHKNAVENSSKQSAKKTSLARPYLFYGQTQSLCEECHAVVPAKIIFQNDNVYYLKRCKEHGAQKTLISTDIEYFKRCKEYIKPGDMPHKFQTKINEGCPYDCGLCPDHEQHSCLAIFDIIDECNMACPICYADSAPKRGNAKSMDDIEKMLSTLLDSEMEPDLVQISGGEPTLHPQIISIIERLRNSPVRHLMLNTNGIRIANDEAFVKQLAEYRTGFEVYLQFDSMTKDALKSIRGIDTRTTHENALQHLEKYNISTNLVCVIKKGMNDHEINDIIEYAQQWKCVRGITFQPIQEAGRTDDFVKNQRITLSDIRRSIIEGSNPFSDADMLPLPCHPESISIGYALRTDSGLQPISGMLPKEILLEGVNNSITFEKNAGLKEAFLKTFSLDACSESSAEHLQTLLCCLPLIEAPDLGYKDVFRVVIMSFMDAYDFCISSVKRSCVHFVTPDGKIYPFDTYNLFYRD